MAKKIKKKGRGGHKEKQVVTISKKSSPESNNPSSETVDAVAPAVKERKGCPHLDKGFDLVKVSSKLGLSEPLKCEDCREESVDRRAGRAKGKHGKKKGGDSKSASKAIWVCLECGHFSCGGVGFPTIPQTHAVRHARQKGHHLAIQFKNPNIRWCFHCDTPIPVQNSEENGQLKDALSDIVKVIKTRPIEGASIDVEDVWFRSGSITNEIKSESTASSTLEGRGGYMVRGLMNLGNTCFFNSVMQNLLAMDKLRDQFSKMEGSIGPLTVSLKKLFVETNPENGLRNVLSPKSLLGCLCARAPQFRGFQQHDSHELLRCLLDGLCIEELTARKQTKSSKEEETPPNPAPTFVDTIFGGKLSSTVSCLECGHSSIVYEPFLDLSLPIPTKRPPSKKAQPVTRPKKPKLPPRRSQRIRSKVNRSTDPVPSNITMASSIDSSLEATDLTPEVSIVGDNKVSDSQNVLDTRGFDSKLVTEKTLDSVNDTAWLDYLDTDFVSSDHDMAFENDALLQHVLEISRQDSSHGVDQTASLTSTPMDYLGPANPSYGPDMASQINNISVTKESGVKDAASNDDFSRHSSESDNQVFPKDSSHKMYYEGNSLENEPLLQVQSSEVILLPFEEDSLTTGETLNGEYGPTLSPVGCEQDPLDFGDIGDLFNEPEDVAGPTVKSSSDNLSESTGIIVGNSSGSDPDEIDDTDAPVSVEKCLSFFTKPELLSKTEHAWNCENCSKALLEEQRRSRKKLEESSSNVSVNVGDGRIQDAQLGSDLSNGNSKKDVLGSSGESLKSQNGNIDANLNCTLERNQKTGEHLVVSQFEKEKSEMNDAFKKLTCNQESSDDSGTAGCNPNKFQQRGSRLSDGEQESEGSEEEEEVDPNSIKVERDATKRILIDKLAPILTVHLKRFSQDARGRISKLNGHVDFSDTVDLRPYMHPRCTERESYKYRLIGVVEHLGTMRGGHYVAYIRGGAKSSSSGIPEKENNGDDSVWYHVSDAYVSQVSFEEVLRCEAYILFYEEI